jgi:hypothetical protein
MTDVEAVGDGLVLTKYFLAILFGDVSVKVSGED